MRSSTSVWSAICGTHFGDTNAVASTDASPAAASRSISSSFTSVGTSRGSFCRPSRGPTSTILTRLEVKSAFRLLHCDQFRTLEHLFAGGEVDFLDHASARRGDGVLHLHRLQDEQGLALLHRLAGPRHHLDDSAGHGRGERAAARFVVRSWKPALEGEPAVIAPGGEVPIVAVAQRAGAVHATVEPNAERTILEHLSGESMLHAVHRKPQARSAEVHAHGMRVFSLD